MKCIQFIELGFYYLSLFIFCEDIYTFIQPLFSCFFIVDLHDIIILNLVKYLHKYRSSKPCSNKWYERQATAIVSDSSTC